MQDLKPLPNPCNLNYANKSARLEGIAEALQLECVSKSARFEGIVRAL